MNTAVDSSQSPSTASLLDNLSEGLSEALASAEVIATLALEGKIEGDGMSPECVSTYLLALENKLRELHKLVGAMCSQARCAAGQ